MPPCKAAWKLYLYLSGTKRKVVSPGRRGQHPAGGSIIHLDTLINPSELQGSKPRSCAGHAAEELPKLPVTSGRYYFIWPLLRPRQVSPHRKQWKKPATSMAFHRVLQLLPASGTMGDQEWHRQTLSGIHSLLEKIPPDHLPGTASYDPRKLSFAKGFPHHPLLRNSTCYPSIHGTKNWATIGKYPKPQHISKLSVPSRRLPSLMLPDGIIHPWMAPPVYRPTSHGGR